MRPCPFCGCVDITLCCDMDRYWVECDGCGARGPVSKWQSDAGRLWDGEIPPEEAFRPRVYL